MEITLGMCEIALYSLLNFVPFLVIALYPFRRNLRFSEKTTALLILAVTVAQLFLGWSAALFRNAAGLISVASTVLYAVFYFLAVKTHFGKTFFTLLMISNLANFAVTTAKCLEGQLFPDFALQTYRWTFSLMLAAVEAVIAVPIFLFIKKIYKPAMEIETSGFEWHYLWFIPATFYVTWYFALYGNISLSSLEIALRPRNAFFSLAINVGAVLIYYVVTRLILERNKTVELQEKNHRLSMMAMQYENLTEKVNEARRAKHDVRHHISVMQEYLEKKEYSALSDYLKQYRKNLPDDSMKFCGNSAVNALLIYFAQQAKESGISYNVRVEIPEQAGIDATDLSVIFGNLIENAVAACAAVKDGERSIIIRGKIDGGALCVTVDNTFSGKLSFAKDGRLCSTKHGGTGLGTESVKSIAEKYGGLCRFETDGGKFCASVLCPIPKA